MKKEIKPYDFVDRQGNRVQLKREDHYNSSPAGKAYGFFDCKASKEEIEAELPAIRYLAQTPSELELSLTDNLGGLEGNTELRSIAQDVKEQGIRYILEGTYQGHSNRETADELSGILNQAYQTSLYEQGEPFSGAIFYEFKGKYISLE